MYSEKSRPISGEAVTLAINTRLEYLHASFVVSIDLRDCCQVVTAEVSKGAPHLCGIILPPHASQHNDSDCSYDQMCYNLIGLMMAARVNYKAAIRTLDRVHSNYWDLIVHEADQHVVVRALPYRSYAPLGAA